MTTKKTSSKKKETPTVSEDSNNLINEAYSRGEEAGKHIAAQEVWKIMSSFIKERMMMHFENHRDDLAREQREILSAINKNIT
jgi:hypothetical protein|tara:strand:+ start:1429 stop:1677 length:249 start_codon:yes stop_codon:yes gene_type:complete